MIAINSFSVVDHPGVDVKLCAAGRPFGGHVFECDHVADPGNVDAWAATILYCKRCGAIRELCVSGSDAGS